MTTTIEHTKNIDGILYTTRTLPASDGLRILPKLLALFREPVLKLMFTANEDQRAELLNDPKIQAAILHGMAENAADTDGLLVVRDLLKATKADKVRIGETKVEDSVHTHFDGHFAGRYGHLANVVMWVASINFVGL